MYIRVKHSLLLKKPYAPKARKGCDTRNTGVMLITRVVTLVT